jgi:hypothetical protein
MAVTYESIATVDVTSTTQAVFSSIPTTYTDLRIVATFLQNVDSPIYLLINNDSNTNYNGIYIRGDGSAVSAGVFVNQDTFTTSSFNSLGGYPAFITWDLMNYTNTNEYKTVLCENSATNSGQNDTLKYAGTYRGSTNRISTIKVFTNATFNSGTITLYGIKAA